jgi:hypothetical protein
MILPTNDFPLFLRRRPLNPLISRSILPERDLDKLSKPIGIRRKRSSDEKCDPSNSIKNIVKKNAFFS